MAIEISLNGKAVATQAQTLSGLLVEQGYAGAKIATALNGEFVPATKHEDCRLQAGDQIEIVAPRQGG